MISEKVLLVTGAASGLGRATAARAAEMGATVVMNDLGTSTDGDGADESALEEAVTEIAATGGDVTASFGDGTDPAYIEGAIDEILDEHGRLDGVVNYAGFLRDSMSFNMTRDEWDGVTDVHLTGHFNLIQAAGKHWRALYKRDELDAQRSFVSVSSASARGSVGQVNYSAAKAGVLGLTRTAARELYQYDVRVNAILPAAFTRGLKANVPEDVLESLTTDEERAGADRVAPLTLALLADETEDVTGQTFAIGVDTVYLVSDPELKRKAIMKGGWTSEAIVDTFDGLLDDAPRTKTEPGGLLSRVL